MRRSWGRRSAATVVGIFVVGTSACSGADGESTATDTPPAIAPAPAPATPAEPSSTDTGPSAAVPASAPASVPGSSLLSTATPSPASTADEPGPSVGVDGPVLLATALAATAVGYHFTSTASVGGQVAVTVEGDHTQDGTQMRVTSQGATVDYLVLDGRSWVFDADEWQELDDDDAAVEDPLAQLGEPISVASPSIEGELIRLVVTYPAAALGLSGTEIDVLVEIVADRITALEYVTTVDGIPAMVRAELSPLVDPVPPVTAPDA